MRKNVSLAKINLSEAEDLIATNNPDDMAMAYEKLGEIIKRFELSKDKTMQYLMEKDEDLENLSEDKGITYIFVHKSLHPHWMR